MGPAGPFAMVRSIYMDLILQNTYSMVQSLNFAIYLNRLSCLAHKLEAVKKEPLAIKKETENPKYESIANLGGIYLISP
jgi:hypothetical protein